jgi:hypothetical protein
MKRFLLLDSLVLLFLTSLLIWPLFSLEWLGEWSSIESTFIADARMLAQNLPHPGWQPLWYGGTRFDYIYPPALRYGTALISVAGHVSTARAYHLYTAVLYALGIVAVYWLVRAGSASRIAALVAAAAAALLSPSFLFLTAIRHDSFHLVPQRLHVLMHYGEGPHISALSVLPAALAAAFPALRRYRPAALALAAVLCAFVVANNFYGAMAIAIFFPIQVWAVWLGERSPHVWLRAAAIGALAWGLCAFWLTPSYIRITLLNLKWVSQPGNSWSLIAAAVVVALFCVTSLLLVNRRPDRAWTVFVAGAALFMSADVLGGYFTAFHVTGDALRFVPELDLALILALIELMRLFRRRSKLPIVAAILVILAFVPAAGYLRHAWYPFPVSEPLNQRYEFRVSRWVQDHLPGERVLPSGSVRFWFDAWADNAQPDGGSAQGMLNQILPTAIWQIVHGNQAGPAVLWLQALGTDAVIVPDKSSLEIYHDYSDPRKFRGALSALYDDHAGTAIYRVPRIHPGIGRIVSDQALASIGILRAGDDASALTKYVAAIENPAYSAAPVTWAGFDHVRVEATLATGQSILLQESYDPAWKAQENGKSLTIRPDRFMNFMLIEASPGPHDIHLRFETPLENRMGQVLFGIAALVTAGLVFARQSTITR